jgi:hypothetical protein
VVLSNLLTSVEEMDSTAGFALRPVDEGIDVEKFVINKADRFKTRSRRGEVRAPDQDIDIARISDGVLVNPGDSLGDGVAAGDRVKDAGCIKGPGGSTQALFRPFPPP